MAGMKTTSSSTTSSASSTSSINAPLPPLVDVISKATSGPQRPNLAAAKDSLAAASVATAASLPLMIGGRSKCVFNVLDNPKNGSHNHHQRFAIGPKNTAIRAEQRARVSGAVSVVRPVMSNLSQEIHIVNGKTYDTETSSSIKDEEFTECLRKAKPSSLLSDLDEKSQSRGGGGSLLDELIDFEERILGSSSSIRGLHQQQATQLSNGSSKLAYQSQVDGNNKSRCSFGDQMNALQYNEFQLRQQAAILRREEFELTRHIKRQHRFVSSKIEDRKRSLQIVRSVWLQKDFKHSIEKMIDLYQQGLVFTYNDNNDRNDIATHQQQKLNGSTLSSLNTGIVADILSVILLRPKLWNLEICQLLLPIIVGDLLVQDPTRYENYVEIALKSLKLILNHFAQVIKTTLDDYNSGGKSTGKQSDRNFSGVDLSREDRVNKCQCCHKYLLEARTIISRRLQQTTKSATGSQAKLLSNYRELVQSFNCLDNETPNSNQVTSTTGVNDNASAINRGSCPVRR